MISSKDSILHNSNNDNEQVSLNDNKQVSLNDNEQVSLDSEESEVPTPTDEISRDEQLATANERITKLEAQLAETQQHERDSRLRAQAEIENVRRRSALDVEKGHRFAIERFAIELLPVIDNLERALEMSDNSELASTIEGIELTLKSMLDTVRKFGIDVVSETSVPFNPEVHQAMTMRESDEYEPNHVMSVMQKGYTLNGRLIRPAMVVVATSTRKEIVDNDNK